MDCDRDFIVDAASDLENCCAGTEHTALWHSHNRCSKIVAPAVKAIRKYVEPFQKCLKQVEKERDVGDTKTAIAQLMLKIKSRHGLTSVFLNRAESCGTVRRFPIDTYESLYRITAKMFKYARNSVSGYRMLPQVKQFLQLCKPDGLKDTRHKKIKFRPTLKAGVTTLCHVKLGQAYSKSVQISGKLTMTLKKCRKNPTLARGCEDFWTEQDWERNWKVFCRWYHQPHICKGGVLRAYYDIDNPRQYHQSHKALSHSHNK